MENALRRFLTGTLTSLLVGVLLLCYRCLCTSYVECACMVWRIVVDDIKKVHLYVEPGSYWDWWPLASLPPWPLSPLSLAMPRSLVGAMSTGDGFGHRLGRNGEFCVAVGPVTCRIAGILYAILAYFGLLTLAAQMLKGMSSLETDFTVCVRKSPSSCNCIAASLSNACSVPRKCE